MAYYNEYDQLVETDEERRKREEEEAAKRGETVASEHKVINYEDGSKTIETKHEVPPGQPIPPQPGLGTRIGNAVQQAGQNFVNNVQNAPANFQRNLQQVPERIQQGINRVTSISPEDVFKRMQGIESGNRDYDAQGRPIQSPVGAMYKNQVMPATAANPGYGIRPAQNNSPEEYNRVGQEYFQALVKQFGGDTQKAAAAYNAGPGRVQQNLRANQGQLNIAQLPRETQGYLQKIGNAVSNVIPSAQAAEAPRYVRAQAYPGEGVAVATGNGVQGTTSMRQPVSPEEVQQQAQQPETPAPQNQYSLATGQGGQGLRMPNGQLPQPQAEGQGEQTTAAINRYQESQNDPIALVQLRSDTSQPEWIRQRAGDRVAEMITSENNRKLAEKTLPTMSANDLAKAATKKSEGNSVGDWLQYLLFKHVGLTDLANEKGEQLGIGHKWEGAMDTEGNTGMIKYSASGKPLEGTKSDGSQMTAEELAKFSTGGGKASDVSGTQKQALVNGELHTFSTKKTAQGTFYRDDTAGTGWTMKAPSGMTHLGQQDPGHIKGLTAMNTVMTKMRKDSQSVQQSTGKPLYTEEQIQQEGRQAYQSVSGKPFGGGGFAAANEEGQVQQQAPAANAPAAAPAKGPKTLAQQILDYEAPLPPPSARDPGSVALRNEVNRLASEQGKTFNASNFKIASNFNNSQSGKALKSINVAVDHLDTLQEAANELKNGPTPAFNKIANLYATNTGETAPGNFNALKSIVGAEVAKAVTGGASALGDREEIRKEISDAKNPEQLAGIIGRLQALMAGQAKGIRQEWVSSGLDEKTFDSKLMPRTKVVLNQQKEPSRSKW